jgi:DNA-directed RNA polymerase subunit RPC12/RpoP
MRVMYKCMVCNEVFERGVRCPQCESDNFVTAYQCDLCKKTWFWRSSEKECCAKKKEERSKKNG